MQVIGSHMSKEKIGLNKEFAWGLVYVTALPELVCYHNGSYLTHHSKLAKVGDAVRVGDAVKDWFAATKKKLRRYVVPACASTYLYVPVHI